MHNLLHATGAFHLWTAALSIIPEEGSLPIKCGCCRRGMSHGGGRQHWISVHVSVCTIEENRHGEKLQFLDHVGVLTEPESGQKVVCTTITPLDLHSYCNHEVWPLTGRPEINWCQDYLTNQGVIYGFPEGRSKPLEALAQTRHELFRKPLGPHKRHKHN